MRARLGLVLVGALSLAGPLGCRQEAPVGPASPRPQPPPDSAGWEQPVSLAAPRSDLAFGGRTYLPASVEGTVPDQRPKRDLSHVANLKEFAFLSDVRRAALRLNGFAVVPTDDPQLDTIYRRNLADGRPSFITADTAVYAFHRLLEDTLRRIETESFPGLLTALTLTLLERSEEQYRTVVGSELKEAARRNIAYLAVAASLMGLEVEVESGAARMAKEELAQITAHQGPRRSRIFPYRIDYSRFVPSGLYTASERLARYYDTLTWYAAAPFATRRIGAHGETAETWREVRQALLLCHALAAPPDAPIKHWEALAGPRQFLVGSPLELGPIEVLAAAAEVYGPTRSLRDYDDFAKLKTFAKRLGERRREPLVPPPPRAEWPGPVQFRLLGPPYEPDAEILAELAAPARRDVASGLDVFAALGHPGAEALLRGRYRVMRGNPRYREVFARLQERLTAVDDTAWRRNLYWGRLWACAPLNGQMSGRRPWFQTTAAWRDKALLTTLASWAAVRHRPWLAAPAAPDLRPELEEAGEPPLGYVEPVPEVFARLRWLSQATTDGLERHGLLTEPIATAHRTFDDLAAFLQETASKELRNRELSLEDHRRIAFYGHELRWLINGLDSGLGPRNQRLPLVADIAPAGADERLYAAIGPVQIIDVIVPIGGKLYIARGAMLSYHEFLRPASDELTDESWQKLLAEGAAPGQPEWAASFVIPNRHEPGLPAATAPPVFVQPGAS